jgi:hypothetical protein
MKEIIELSDKEITIDRNEFLKVKGSIDQGKLILFFIKKRIKVIDLQLFK